MVVGGSLSTACLCLDSRCPNRERTISIRVSKEVRAELERLKVHRREPYDDVIRRLLEHWRRTRQ